MNHLPVRWLAIENTGRRSSPDIGRSSVHRRASPAGSAQRSAPGRNWAGWRWHSGRSEISTGADPGCRCSDWRRRGRPRPDPATAHRPGHRSACASRRTWRRRSIAGHACPRHHPGHGQREAGAVLKLHLQQEPLARGRDIAGEIGGAGQHERWSPDTGTKEDRVRPAGRSGTARARAGGAAASRAPGGRRQSERRGTGRSPPANARPRSGGRCWTGNSRRRRC